MDVDETNEKYSIKNMLFYRAIPIYKIKEPINGQKLYGCLDCGDRFTLESSYHDHISRKSVKISYTCRRCSVVQQQVFYNRCNLLAHIRSHSFKTATINCSDLKIEPLPMSFFKTSGDAPPQTQIAQSDNVKELVTRTVCIECNKDITTPKGSPNKDRAIHYMKYTNRFHSCPVCLLTMHTICALKSHLRVHLKTPPYFCPECGYELSNKIVNYPFSHSCEGFNMMRATVRLECPVPKCQSSLFHPYEFKKHLRADHMKRVFKCPHCVVACFSEATISKHLEIHQSQNVTNNINILIFHQCDMCPGRLVLQSHLESHITAHNIDRNVYPCWTCGVRYKNIPLLIEHHINVHVTSNITLVDELKNALNISRKCNDTTKSIAKNVFRVVKRCDQCLRSFTYKCNFEDIKILPNACPYKCTSITTSLLKPANMNNSVDNADTLLCPLCKESIYQNWENVKKHFALHHKNHKCLDGKVMLLKTDLKIKKKRNRRRKFLTSAKVRRVPKNNKCNNEESKKSAIAENHVKQNAIGGDLVTSANSDLVCVKCQIECKSKEDLESHIKSHRDPCMAYQCLECYECFVVKPSFTTHLLIKHGITDVDDYIEKKQCYNNDALNNHKESDHDMPVGENQCRICRETFVDSEELEKHFRVHGMAFLIKNAQTKSTVS